MSKTETERREHTRIQLGICCDIFENDIAIKATTLDLSLRGISCTLPNAIPLFTKITLQLQLPQEAADDDDILEELNCDGVVVRCEELADHDQEAYKTAIFFPHLSTIESRSIECFLDHNI